MRFTSVTGSRLPLFFAIPALAVGIAAALSGIEFYPLVVSHFVAGGGVVTILTPYGASIAEYFLAFLIATAILLLSCAVFIFYGYVGKSTNSKVLKARNFGMTITCCAIAAVFLASGLIVPVANATIASNPQSVLSQYSCEKGPSFIVTVDNSANYYAIAASGAPTVACGVLQYGGPTNVGGATGSNSTIVTQDAINAMAALGGGQIQFAVGVSISRNLVITSNHIALIGPTPSGEAVGPGGQLVFISKVVINSASNAVLDIDIENVQMATLLFAASANNIGQVWLQNSQVVATSVHQGIITTGANGYISFVHFIGDTLEWDPLDVATYGTSGHGMVDWNNTNHGNGQIYFEQPKDDIDINGSNFVYMGGDMGAAMTFDTPSFLFASGVCGTLFNVAGGAKIVLGVDFNNPFIEEISSSYCRPHVVYLLQVGNGPTQVVFTFSSPQLDGSYTLLWNRDPLSTITSESNIAYTGIQLPFTNVPTSVIFGQFNQGNNLFQVITSFAAPTGGSTFNPIANPFGTATMGLGQNSTSFSASTNYFVEGAPILMTCTGGTSVSITYRNPNTGGIISGFTCATNPAFWVPVGWAINFGAFSSTPPTVTVNAKYSE